MTIVGSLPLDKRRSIVWENATFLEWLLTQPPSFIDSATVLPAVLHCCVVVVKVAPSPQDVASLCHGLLLALLRRTMLFADQASNGDEDNNRSSSSNNNKEGEVDEDSPAVYCAVTVRHLLRSMSVETWASILTAHEGEEGKRSVAQFVDELTLWLSRWNDRKRRASGSKKKTEGRAVNVVLAAFVERVMQVVQPRSLLLSPIPKTSTHDRSELVRKDLKVICAPLASLLLQNEEANQQPFVEFVQWCGTAPTLTPLPRPAVPSAAPSLLPMATDQWTNSSREPSPPLRPQEAPSPRSTALPPQKVEEAVTKNRTTNHVSLDEIVSFLLEKETHAKQALNDWRRDAGALHDRRTVAEMLSGMRDDVPDDVRDRLEQKLVNLARVFRQFQDLGCSSK